MANNPAPNASAVFTNGATARATKLITESSPCPVHHISTAGASIDRVFSNPAIYSQWLSQNSFTLQE